MIIKPGTWIKIAMIAVALILTISAHAANWWTPHHGACIPVSSPDEEYRKALAAGWPAQLVVRGEAMVVTNNEGGAHSNWYFRSKVGCNAAYARNPAMGGPME
jgi:hypothetical protein